MCFGSVQLLLLLLCMSQLSAAAVLLLLQVPYVGPGRVLCSVGWPALLHLGLCGARALHYAHDMVSSCFILKIWRSMVYGQGLSVFRIMQPESEGQTQQSLSRHITAHSHMLTCVPTYGPWLVTSDHSARTGIAPSIPQPPPVVALPPVQ